MFTHETTPAELGYAPDVTMPTSVNNVQAIPTQFQETDSMVAKVNGAITATIVGFAYVSGEIASHMGESVAQVRVAVVGSGALLLAAYNAQPFLEKYERGRQLIASSQLASEQATFESQQKQRWINEKNQLRVPMKQKTADLIERTKVIRANHRAHFGSNIPGEPLL